MNYFLQNPIIYFHNIIFYLYICHQNNLSTKKTRLNMFGIDDILIILPYLLGIACVIYSAWYGIRNWNKD
jgi:hypothetical protein